MNLKFFTSAFQIAGLLWFASIMSAQTPIPISANFPPPQGFSFLGRWVCSDGNAQAKLQVGLRDKWYRQWQLSGNRAWWPVVESQDDYTVHMLVGYDRDRNEFLTVDSGDPGYAVYRMDGWHGTTMTLTSIPVPDSTMTAHRFVYTVSSPKKFTVSWERLEDGAWKEHDSYTCTTNALWH